MTFQSVPHKKLEVEDEGLTLPLYCVVPHVVLYCLYSPLILYLCDIGREGLQCIFVVMCKSY